MAKSTDIEVAAPPAAQPPAVPAPPDRALNSTQQKNLQKIVEGDFSDLRERVVYEINQQLDRRTKTIDAKYDDRKKLDDAKKKLKAAVEKAREQLRKAVENIEASGVSVAVGGYPVEVKVYEWMLVVEGKAVEVDAAVNAAQRLRSTSSLVLNRREREAQRAVLLSGITTQTAADLINGMPKAADILGEVQAEMAVNNEDDLKALGYTTED